MYKQMIIFLYICWEMVQKKIIMAKQKNGEFSGIAVILETSDRCVFPASLWRSSSAGEETLVQ